MLYDNLIIIFIGVALVAISLYFIVKQNNEEEEDYYYKASLLLNNKDNDTNSNQLLSNQLQAVTEEMEELKQKLAMLESNHLISASVEAAKAAEAPQEEVPFNHALNYQLFVSRNEDIIKLYNEGLGIDEIARTLNKSFREVEMIIKLVK